MRSEPLDARALVAEPAVEALVGVGLAFNVGIEGGQLLVLMSAVTLLRRWVPNSERALAIIVGLLCGHAALHWVTDRMQAFWKAAGLAADWLPIGSIGLLVVLLSGWAVWKGFVSLRRPSGPAGRRPPGHGSEQRRGR